jgi:RNA 3'-terminal phosphate cyclase (ATP)
LSLVTGTPVTLEKIRAGRDKPGLKRQHVVAVEAARQVGAAQVDGARLSARKLVFEPTGIFPGKYHFRIESAGSSTLVLQTVLPALLCADGPCRDPVGTARVLSGRRRSHPRRHHTGEGAGRV